MPELNAEQRERAIRRIEESRKSHADWAEHIPNCDHCKENGPPPHIQTEAEHRQIVAEYDEVLAVLRGHADAQREAAQAVLDAVEAAWGSIPNHRHPGAGAALHAAAGNYGAGCACPPCPGRGNDGHGLTHCAECCYGTGLEADITCPVHGAGTAAGGDGQAICGYSRDGLVCIHAPGHGVPPGENIGRHHLVSADAAYAAPTGTEATTARIAAVLAEHEPNGFSCACGWRNETATYATAHRAHVAAVLSAGVIRDETSGGSDA